MLLGSLSLAVGDLEIGKRLLVLFQRCVDPGDVTLQDLGSNAHLLQRPALLERLQRGIGHLIPEAKAEFGELGQVVAELSALCAQKLLLKGGFRQCFGLPVNVGLYQLERGLAFLLCLAGEADRVGQVALYLLAFLEGFGQARPFGPSFCQALGQLLEVGKGRTLVDAQGVDGLSFGLAHG